MKRCSPVLLESASVRHSIPDDQSHGIRLDPPRISTPVTQLPALFPGFETPAVLIIEDDQAIRELLAQMVARLGLATLCFDSGEHALAYIAEHTPRFIGALIDMQLPGINGVATILALRRLLPLMPVVLVSGYYVGDLAKQAAHLGHIRFLQKPFGYREVAQEIWCFAGSYTAQD